jgi:chromosomal replication initiator protein
LTEENKMSLTQKETDFAQKIDHVSYSEAWQKCCRRLKAELGDDIFGSWFGRLELDAVEHTTAYLSVPTRFLKSWILSHYSEKLLTTLSAEIAHVESISLSIRSSTRAAAIANNQSQAHHINTSKSLQGAVKPPVPESHKLTTTAVNYERSLKRDEGDTLPGSPLDRRFTFDSFLVGTSNQLAHAAALRVASTAKGQAPIYNPLYIYSSVGLGKTHLLQAICHSAHDHGRKVIYLTAEKFMYGFVCALKAHTALAFKEKLRAIDILVIDDVQFLQGKSIQQEFCHTLNSLIDAGKQIVVAADRMPADLESLDERVKSRLSGGLCVDIGALDDALRRKVLENRIALAEIAHSGFSVPSAVVSFVANAIQTNGRDLDGAVNRLVARATLTGAALTVEIAEDAIRDLIRTREPKRVKIEDIQKLVATHYNISRADILSSRRTAVVVRPRQIAMYLAKVLTPRSLPEIGRRFGGRDHTTVLHAVRKIEGLADKDQSLSEEIDLLKRMLIE